MLHPDMELMEYLEIFRRRKWLVIFIMLIILSGAVVYCIVASEQYKSTTTILVIPQRVPESYVRSTVSLQMQDRMATIQQQVMSRTRLSIVMDELGLFQDQRKKVPLDTLIEGMRKRIEIGVKGKDSFTLSFVHDNPKMAMLVTSRLVSFFIDENIKYREQQAVGTSEFLESQLLETKKKLEIQEEKVKQYKTRYMGELPQQMEANLNMLNRLQDQYRTVADSIRSAEERKEFLEARLGLLDMSTQGGGAAGRVKEEFSLEDPVLADPAQTFIDRLKEKRVVLADLSRRYTDEYPEVLRVRNEIEQLEKDVVASRKSGMERSSSKRGVHTATRNGPRQVSPREQSTGLRAQIEAIRLDISGRKTELKQIQKNLSNYQAKVEMAPRREQEIIALVRDYDNVKRLYDELMRKKLDSDISQNLEIRQKGEQFQILDPPNLPQVPFVPDRKKILGIAFMLALVAGMGGPVGFEMLDPTLRNKKSFRNLFDLQILVNIPLVRDSSYYRRQWLHRAAIFGGFASIATALTLFLFTYADKIKAIVFEQRWW
jgi:polysaccharide chain length determinant protein (PEP-CTERM system associated)